MGKIERMHNCPAYLDRIVRQSRQRTPETWILARVAATTLVDPRKKKKTKHPNITRKVFFFFLHIIAKKQKP